MRISIFLVALAFTASAGEKPDILMIAVDDLRPMLGCYGDPIAKTPNIDRLASQSLVFDRAYCQLAKCGPSRLSLLSGMRPENLGIFSHSSRDLERFRTEFPNVKTLPRNFTEHGYHTQCFGKIAHDGWDNNDDWSLPSSPGRDREMWEVYDSESETTIIAERDNCPAIQNPDVSDDMFFAGRMTNDVIHVLEQPSNQPRFLAVGYRRPHLPLVAPKRYFDLYEPNADWLPEHRTAPEGAPIMGWFNSDGYPGLAGKQGFDMPSPPEFIEQGLDWAGYELRSYRGVPNSGPISDEKQLEIRHAYLACISYVDAQIGRLLDAVDLSKTIVVLWSDHGWHLGEQGTWSKMTNYELATRVVFMIASPDATHQPGRTKSLVELLDLYPTLCDLADLPIPKYTEGTSLVPILEDPATEVRPAAKSVFTRYRDKYTGVAIRSDRYRLVTWRNTETGKITATELYDHETDPGETVNIADRPENAAVIEEIRSLK